MFAQGGCLKATERWMPWFIAWTGQSVLRAGILGCLPSLAASQETLPSQRMEHENCTAGDLKELDLP
jgi:hypothetical protein